MWECKICQSASRMQHMNSQRHIVGFCVNELMQKDRCFFFFVMHDPSRVKSRMLDQYRNSPRYPGLNLVPLKLTEVLSLTLMT